MKTARKVIGTCVLLALASTASADVLDDAFMRAAFVDKCQGSAAAWTPSIMSTGGNQSIVGGLRSEGGCSAFFGIIRLGGRADLYGFRGSAALPDSKNPSETVSGVEAWGVASVRVAGPLSVAVFGGGQKSLEGGVLGIGGATNSLCAGARADYGGGYAIAGICNRFSPAQTFLDGKRVDGRAFVGTFVAPVKKGVKLAANAAWLPASRDYFIAMGPAVGLDF